MIWAAPALVCCGLALAAWALRARHRYARATARAARAEARYRERADRCGAELGALLAAARRSPADVLAQIDAALLERAPEIRTVFFAEPREDALEITYARGMQAETLRGRRIDPRGDSVYARAWRAGHHCAADAADAPTLAGERSALAVPLLARGKGFGVLAVATFDRTEFADVAEIVRTVELAVPAYEISLERRADVDAATIDGLTGLLTPVVFRKRLAEELLVAERRETPYTLVFIDTDHFKACNDTLGHGAGDVVLTSIAEIIRARAGIEALAARNGGDEFCVGAHVGARAGLRLAEEIRAAIRAHPYAQGIGAELPVPISASVGVATSPRDGRHAAALLEAADAAMYASKRAGRDRVTAATSSAPEPDSAR